MADSMTLVWKHGTWIRFAPPQPPVDDGRAPWWRELLQGIEKVAADTPAPTRSLPWFIPNLNRMHAARDRELVHRAVPTYDSLSAEGARHALRYVNRRVLVAAYHHERRTAGRTMVLRAIRLRLREVN